MSRRHVMATAALALLALVTNGCMMHAGSLEPIRMNIEHQVPGARFDSEFQLKLGRMSMGLVKRITRAVDDEDEEDLAFLQNIRSLELAVYETRSLPKAADLDIPKLRKLKRQGWMTAIESRAEDSVTWVLFRQQDDRVSGILVGALDDDELVLVKLNGDIQNVFDQLMDEGILDVPGVVQADLDPEPGEPIAVVEAN